MIWAISPLNSCCQSLRRSMATLSMGPVVSEVQFNKIQGLIQAGIDEGATLVTGGTGRPDGIEKGYFHY